MTGSKMCRNHEVEVEGPTLARGAWATKTGNGQLFPLTFA